MKRQTIITVVMALFLGLGFGAVVVTIGNDKPAPENAGNISTEPFALPDNIRQPSTESKPAIPDGPPDAGLSDAIANIDISTQDNSPEEPLPEEPAPTEPAPEEITPPEEPAPSETAPEEITPPEEPTPSEESKPSEETTSSEKQPDADDSPSKDTGEGKIYVVLSKAGGANVRTGPGESYEKICSVRPGKEVTVIGYTNYWYKVKLDDGTVGYSFSELLAPKN